MNLANCKICQNFLPKILLPKIKSIRCITSQLNSASKLNSMLSFMNRPANSIDRLAASSQLASTTLVKLLGYLCHIICQPADNQQVHPINTSYRMELQTIAPCRSIASQLYCGLTWPDPIFMQGIIIRSISGGAYTVNNNVPARKYGLAMRDQLILYYTANDNHLLWSSLAIQCETSGSQRLLEYKQSQCITIEYSTLWLYISHSKIKLTCTDQFNVCIMCKNWDTLVPWAYQLCCLSSINNNKIEM